MNNQGSGGNPSAKSQPPELISGLRVVLSTAAVLIAVDTYCITSITYSEPAALGSGPAGMHRIAKDPSRLGRTIAARRTQPQPKSGIEFSQPTSWFSESYQAYSKTKSRGFPSVSRKCFSALAK